MRRQRRFLFKGFRKLSESAKRDIKNFLGLFLASIIVNYFFPRIMAYAWFFGILITFLKTRSENHYFWIVFFWLILSYPGNLFHYKGVHALPTISVPGFGREIFFSEMICMAMIGKAFLFPVKQKCHYSVPLRWLIGYSVFLLLLGLITGPDIYTFLKSIRYFIPILLLPFISRLLPYRKIPDFLFLMFVSSFILFSAQLSDIITGRNLAFYVGDSLHASFEGEIVVGARIFDVTRRAVRSIYGPFILLISLVFSMALLTTKKRLFTSNFLYAVSLIAATSIFLSATRGWILGAAIIFAGFGYFQPSRMVNYISIGILSIILITTVPQINLQIKQVMERVSTLSSLAQGDLTAGGSLSRLTDRSPRVMNKFWEQPVFGFGFSNEYYEYSDGHVGNQTLLLNGGFIGYAVFLYFIFYFLLNYIRSFIKQKNKAIMICMFGLLSLIVIHSSSRMIFSFSLNVQTALSLSLFFLISDYFLRHHYRDENNSH